MQRERDGNAQDLKFHRARIFRAAFLTRWLTVYGIRTTGSTLVVRNHVTGGSALYTGLNLSTGQNGPIVTAVVGAYVSNTNPWENFQG